MYIQREILEEELRKLVVDLVEEIEENIEHDIEEVWAYNKLVEYLMEKQKVIDYFSQS